MFEQSRTVVARSALTIAVITFAAAPVAAQSWHQGRIAFSTGYGPSDIGVMKPHGRARRDLTAGMFARYSPDGRRIVFMSGSWRTADPQNLFIINANGTQLRQLTFNQDITVQDRYPCFTPDGEHVVFAHVELDPRYPPESGAWMENIAIMRADGTGFRLLTENTAWQSSTGPICAPDGRIVFTSHTDYSFVYKLYVMGPDGSGPRQLTDIPGTIQIDADASPDGRKVAFCAFNTSDWQSAEVYTVDLDGPGINAGLRQLTTDGLPGGIYNITPVFSPDSRWLVYSAGPEYSDASYGVMKIIRADGLGPTVVVPNSENAWPNSWRR